MSFNAIPLFSNEFFSLSTGELFELCLTDLVKKRDLFIQSWMSSGQVEGGAPYVLIIGIDPMKWSDGTHCTLEEFEKAGIEIARLLEGSGFELKGCCFQPIQRRVIPMGDYQAIALTLDLCRAIRSTPGAKVSGAMLREKRYPLMQVALAWEYSVQLCKERNPSIRSTFFGDN